MHIFSGRCHAEMFRIKHGCDISLNFRYMDMSFKVQNFAVLVKSLL